jgi:transposase-like protein
MVVNQQCSGSGSFLGAQRSGGERSEPERSGAPKNDARPAPPSAEVSAHPTRRRFTAAYKLALVQEADRCTEPGQIGALLRREGLYSSHLGKWRKLRDAGALDALGPRPRGPKAAAPTPLQQENEQLRRENARLQKKLQKAEMVIEFQKKVAALLEIPLNRPEDEGSD